MAAEQVEQVRRFNRTGTQRVGALDDHFLSLDRPLGEARVLWEIGAGGCEIPALRERGGAGGETRARGGGWGLAPAHLGGLRPPPGGAGMIAGPADEHAGGVRGARARDGGRAELGELARRSDALAASLLEPLTAAQR